jgi:nucleoside-diphosphate-sugar epimerase
MTLVILGCGYTGTRVARRVADRGERVICTSRSPEQIHGVEGIEFVRFDIRSNDSLDFVPRGSHILYSIPPVDSYDSTPHWRSLASRVPRRIVYLSTTGVYGDAFDVDETTPPAPRDEHDRQRLEAEAAVLNGPWSSLVLRSAAIYGPGRGIHVSMMQGRFRLIGAGDNFVSRIHVDDLATHAEAGLYSDLGGAWPVADEQPCTSREIAEYCAARLGVPMPQAVPADEVHRTRRANRRVDGTAIRRKLGISLRYPGYREGIEAST